MKQSIIILSLFIFLLAGCSSAPKKPAGVFDIRNQAAGFAAFGNDYYAKGDFSQAARFFSDALTAYTSVFDPAGMAMSRISLAKVMIATGEFEAAANLLTTAAQNKEGVKPEDAQYPNLSAEFALTQGLLLLAQGKNDEALASFEEVLSIPGKKPSNALLARVYHNIASVYKLQENWTQAREYAEKALVLNEKEKEYSAQASNHYLLASLSLKQGDSAGSIEHLEKALVLDRMMEDSLSIVQDLRAIGSVQFSAGNRKEAYRAWRNAYDILISLPGESIYVSRLISIVKLLAPLAGEFGDPGDTELFSGFMQKYIPEEK